MVVKIVLLTLVSLQVGCICCQDTDSSVGQIFGMLTSALGSVSNTTTQGLLKGFCAGSGALENLSANTLESALKGHGNRGTVNEDCANHVGILIQALQKPEPWALRMLDAMGKPPTGLMDMKVTWLGDWDECIRTEAEVYDNQTAILTHPFTGKYCSVAIPVSLPQLKAPGASIHIGLCVPSSCSASDAEELIRIAIGNLPTNISLPDPTVTCQKTKLSQDGRAIVAIVICSIFLAVMTLATVYDIVYVNWLAEILSGKPSSQDTETEAKVNGGFSGLKDDIPQYNPDATKYDVASSDTTTQGTEKYKPGRAGRLLLSFSMFTNGTKLLNTQQPKGSLTAINGIRFISMTWVIIGHGFGFLYTPVAENGLKYGFDLAEREEFAAVLNANFSVDTFFVLSGLLVSYLSLKEMKKRNSAKKFNWKMFYFHRFWRLTPPYMLTLMLYVCIVRYVTNGPLWRQDGHTDKDCTHGWWKNLLYVNNFVKGEAQLGCMPWTWYLANDMQFYIISPLMLIPLYYSRLYGALSCLAFLLVSMISSGIVSMHYELPASTMYERSKSKTFTWHYYVKPWCRIGPYVVGVFTGYLLYRYKQKTKIPRAANLTMWMNSITIACLIIYGLFSEDTKNPFSQPVSSLFNATARSAWGLCVAWVIFACATGYGGPVNHFLSWPGFVPLARLTYFAYLAHPIMEEIYIYGQFKTLYVYDYMMVYMMLGHICTSYAAAFVLSLAFEAPMMGLEKVLLGREKHS